MLNLKWPGKQWLAERALKKKRRETIALCQQLYDKIPSFSLAQHARTQQQLFSYEYIYGEINFTSFSYLLDRCKIQSDSIFYDLGSGVGKAVMCAALLYDFQKVCGIEQLQLLHDQAYQVQQLSKDLRAKNIDLYHADLLTFDWQDGDIIFINASAFIGDFWQQVLIKLKQLKPGAQIIIVSKLLPTDDFTMLYSDFLPMSWGLARVGIYAKCDQELVINRVDSKTKQSNT